MAHTEQAIYFFTPTAENITKFETIDNELALQLHYYFTSQLVVIGSTNIKTNFIDPQTGEHILAKICTSYFCTGFDFEQEIHEFMMTFDDIHYFDNQQAAENFKNGIIGV